MTGNWTNSGMHILLLGLLLASLSLAAPRSKRSLSAVFENKFEPLPQESSPARATRHKRDTESPWFKRISFDPLPWGKRDSLSPAALYKKATFNASPWGRNRAYEAVPSDAGQVIFEAIPLRKRVSTRIDPLPWGKKRARFDLLPWGKRQAYGPSI